MKISDMIKLASVGPKNRKSFDLMAFNSRWEDSRHTAKDLEKALDRLFNAVGPDLGVDDYSDPAFIDYAGDKMASSQVPNKMTQNALVWLKRGGRGKIKE